MSTPNTCGLPLVGGGATRGSGRKIHYGRLLLLCGTSLLSSRQVGPATGSAFKCSVTFCLFSTASPRGTVQTYTIAILVQTCKGTFQVLNYIRLLCTTFLRCVGERGGGGGGGGGGEGGGVEFTTLVPTTRPKAEKVCSYDMLSCMVHFAK